MNLPPTSRAQRLLPIAGALALVANFVLIAHEVTADAWTAADSWILLHLHALASPAADVIMRGFTFFGSAPMVIPLVLVTIAWCLQRGERRLAASLALVALVAEGANVALKHVFVRARPALWAGALHLDSYSFPSGHSMSAAATLGMIAVVIARLAPRFRLATTVLAPLVIFGVGLSRMYLGAHWPTDVLGGFDAGSLVLLGGALVSSRPGR